MASYEFAKLASSKPRLVGSTPTSSALILRRDARADEWGCLENSCAFTGTVGSNPTLAANKKHGEQFSGFLVIDSFYSLAMATPQTSFASASFRILAYSCMGELSV